ncbi:hypothetical protein PACTADRAFT_49665 [Pachysolen tannophilus NRRL Y-2460]|uniref:Sister chromatid cohesion protein DCC1 n=1 Tax=Pachysolen tannophilus NRRL Y-2460 TaxID=669874 RepID=A0A1E4TX20_PACTA|nr:hypothetical protein PACTADRAFT_49665 [Pachysolen tannophilus NRRL Y-2460]
MKTMETYSYLVPDASYKLIELSPELLEVIKLQKSGISIKASSHDSLDLVLTTDTKTFQLREKKHSNTQLLIKEKNEKIIGFSSFGSALELNKTIGRINYSNVPIYNGNLSKFKERLLKNQSISISVDELILQSPISRGEFDNHWIELNGSEIENIAVILSSNFITEILTLLINIIIANDLNFNNLNLYKIFQIIEIEIENEIENITIDILETVLKKFSKNLQNPFKIDFLKISKWYGIEMLKLYSTNSIEIDEFCLNWKSSIPSSLTSIESISIDLNMLKGYYYKITGSTNKIKYLNKHSLPMDNTSRFKALFQLNKYWDLDEFEPFIIDLNEKNLKITSFIMKYARVQKQGNKTIISSR